MNAETTSLNGAIWRVRAPEEQTMAVVFASPHSGKNYSPDFLAASRLDPRTLRRSEDSFVDQIFATAPEHGAPLLHALFPRAYLDPHREPFELAPEMFEDALPSYVNSRTARVTAGVGTIARVVAGGQNIYKGKLRFAEAAERIDNFYRPYHRALRELVDQTRERLGRCLLIDCHSMPSVSGPMDGDAGMKRVDFVLGDCFGTSCASAVTDGVEDVLKAQGYGVARNTPYSGGYTTVHYGRPSTKVHALQIEVNRALYMDEATMQPTQRMGPLVEHMSQLIASLKELSKMLPGEQ